MAEGFLEITGITVPESAQEGDTVNFTIHVRNTSEKEDNFKIEMHKEGFLYDIIEIELFGGDRETWDLSFTMPNHDVLVTIKTYRLNSLWILNDEASFTITLTIPPPAYIYVSSTPLRANIYLDGSYIGITDNPFKINPGTYTLKLTKSGYYDYEEIFTITEGETKTFNITLEEIPPPPPPTEGFLTITGVNAPAEVKEGETFSCIVHTQNTGASDDFKLELSGDLTGSQEFFLGAGLTKDVPFSFTMPNKDISVTANTYHYEEELGWVWDVTSVWDVNRWN